MTTLTNPVTPHTVNDALQLSDLSLNEVESEPSQAMTPGLPSSLSSLSHALPLSLLCVSSLIVIVIQP
jgi:hypothetical protein